MKKASRIIIWICVALLVITSGFSCLFLWRISQAAAGIADDFQKSRQDTEGVTVSEENGIFALYQTLYENLDRYGGLESSMDSTTQLADVLLNRTIGQWTIDDITWKEDGFLVTVHSAGVSLSELDGGFVSGVLLSASGDLLKNHFMDTAASLFQGEEAVKKVLYGSFGPLIFEAAAQKAEDLPSKPETFVLQITSEEGEWKIRTLSQDENPAEDAE